MQAIIKALLSENENVQRLHWSICAALSIACFQCGCKWHLTGDKVDAGGAANPPQKITLDPATGQQVPTPALPRPEPLPLHLLPHPVPVQHTTQPRPAEPAEGPAMPPQSYRLRCVDTVFS